MTTDPRVIVALEAALGADPTNGTLRAHLADLLAGAGRHGDAIRHAQLVLAQQPDHLGAIMVMATSGALEGHPQAEAFARMAAALGGEVPPPPPAGTTPPHVLQPLALDVPNTADELVDQWAGTEPLAEPDVGDLAAPGITLADVGGLDQVKQRLELSFLAPMRNPELQAQFGKSLRGGLLLWGPPGCGKTFIARAVAGELGAAFYSVGLADVLDMYIGNSERNIRSIFEVARRNRPCVLFFDEIDALGHKRSQLRNGGVALRGVVNQLLAELDGVDTDNEGVFVLGATNHPWDVDPAMLRPGRFDRKLLVMPPDELARVAILARLLAGRPTEDLDLHRLAVLTDGLTGADLGLVCEQATEVALADSIRTGSVRPIRQVDLVRAASSTRPSIGGWLDTARNFAMYNNEGNEYDDLLAYLHRRR